MGTDWRSVSWWGGNVSNIFPDREELTIDRLPDLSPSPSLSLTSRVDEGRRGLADKKNHGGDELVVLVLLLGSDGLVLVVLPGAVINELLVLILAHHPGGIHNISLLISNGTQERSLGLEDTGI